MKQINVKAFIRADISKMESYIPVPSLWDLGENFIKLDQNENPYGFSPKINKALADYKLYNYYPDPECKELRKILAGYVGVKEENITVGSGSDELLDLILRLVLNQGDKVINCPPTFGIYPKLIGLNFGKLVSVPRKNNFSLDFTAIKENVDEKVKLIIICNPNNPTGNIVDQEEIIEILRLGKLVIVDEAYFEFYGKTSASLLKKYDNLIILRTFSKWAGIAGLRLGYTIASPFLIKQLVKIKSPFNVNLAAAVAGKVALQDLTQSKFIIQKIIKERERVYRQLQKLLYITVYLSKANFVFIKVNKNLSKLRNYLEKKKIVVRYYDSDLTGEAIRLSIGKSEQNNRVIKALEEFKYEKN